MRAVGAHDSLSESIKTKLLESLFDQPAVLAIASLVPMALTTICFYRTSMRWYLVALVVFVLVAAARLWINVAFLRASGERSGRVWRRRFLIGTCAAAIANGIIAARALHQSDPFIQMLVVSSIAPVVIGAAARNAVYPAAAYSYIALSEVSPFLAAVTATDRYYLFYPLFVLILVTTAFSIVRIQYKQTVGFLLAEERNAGLVDAVHETNIELGRANAQLEMLGSEKDLALAEQQRYFRTVVANAPVILIASTH